MELEYKEDWEQARERIGAWWQGEVIDRAVIQVTAPKAGSTYVAPAIPDDRLLEWSTDPDCVIPRLEQAVAATYWGGEAVPVMFPVSISLVAIPAAYLGCPYTIVPISYSGWASPIITDWATRRKLTFDPQNKWWLLSRQLLQAASQRAPGRYCVGLPDLNGPGELAALLRGPDRLAIDLLEQPDAVKAALVEANAAWLRYWEASIGTIHQWQGGYVHWMGIWSDVPSTDLQCDFSCMISPAMFQEFFLPGLDQQAAWVSRTIYHLDGPNAIRHLDLLLALPHLTGIQWVPGAGALPMSRWIRLLRRIQAGGKLLVAECEPWEVEVLLGELEPEGLLVKTHCASESEARELLRHAARWSAHRQWVVA